MKYEKATIEVIGSAALAIRSQNKVSDDPDSNSTIATASAYEADE